MTTPIHPNADEALYGIRVHLRVPSTTMDAVSAVLAPAEAEAHNEHSQREAVADVLVTLADKIAAGEIGIPLIRVVLKGKWNAKPQVPQQREGDEF